MLPEMAVEVDQLNKSFTTWWGRTTPSLISIDLHVRRGTVHGFLGPNGAGKSTTIRALMGLTRCNGRMRVFGHEVPEHLPRVIHRVGAIVERPRFPTEFSGYRNLRHLAGSLGLPNREIGRVLDICDLNSAAHIRYGAYSLGMKQRLAIAAALLTEPDLIILDEPTNGLDPQGIRHMRQLTRRLADEGRTVLISTHLLAEVEQIADDITIVNGGRTVAAGSLDAFAGGRQRWRLTLAAHEASASVAQQTLQQRGWQVVPEGGALIVLGDEPGYAITQTLTAAGLWVESLTPVSTGLEETFLQLTAPGVRPGELPPTPITSSTNPHHGSLR
ncbi:ABC transporter ATP-binding protein [Propioniferax innocua]|uniref:ABC-2 type transport system ATP-binding protein n=1 Tax=Propioniferax innocua TaxID=1753 RepID=A0A542ZR97_9ACTN|nr:ATP-binding cassette domain-containing protein [Propioniferax innocua]TQL62871.1 ABC-2 type transport system ATP-binding protein [Propioniferax innocua]